MNRFPTNRQPDDPWFRVGNIDVTTTVLVAGLAAASMVVWAVARPVWDLLWLAPRSVRSGQVWRIVTWPLANEPTSIWTLLDIAVFYIFGRELERRLTRPRFVWLLSLLVVIPGIVGTLLLVPIAGLNMAATALFAAFVAAEPNARSFFNIPLWGLGAGFLGLNVLQYVGYGQWRQLGLLLAVVGLALVGARSFGISEIHWIPRIPLPGASPSKRRDPKSKRPKVKPPKQKRGARRGPGEVIPISSSRSLDELMAQAELDMLLDKISSSGLDSLTPDERRRLDDHSRRGPGQR